MRILVLVLLGISCVMPWDLIRSQSTVNMIDNNNSLTSDGYMSMGVHIGKIYRCYCQLDGIHRLVRQTTRAHTKSGCIQARLMAWARDLRPQRHDGVTTQMTQACEYVQADEREQIRDVM